MTTDINLNAGIQSDAITFTTTAKTAILTGSNTESYTLLKFSVIATSGTPTIELNFSDNTRSEVLIYPATALNTSTVTVIETELNGHSLRVGDELKATVSDTNVQGLLTYAVRGGGSGT